MTSLSHAVLPTAELSAELTDEIFALAEAASGDSFDRAYLERRLALYPSVAIARDRHGLAAFVLLDVRRRGMQLVYLGPLFSRRGAYVGLFAHCVEWILDSGEPFCLGMEIENPLVRDVLGLLLPTCAHPRRGEEPSEIIRALGRIFATEFDHVRGLDERTLTTVIEESVARPGLGMGRYQLAVIPCAGDADSRATLRSELSRGLENLAAMRGTRPSEEASRERNPLRANS